MTERIPCKNPECSRTILPSTAESTQGLCMPCVQAAVAKKRNEYIQTHRRDINEFEGITDKVEILKLAHKPRQHDPLINWIPCQIPTDQLYMSLTQEEQRRLADYAESLITNEQDEEADILLLCLAAFTDCSLDHCLRALIARDKFFPSFPFYCASPNIRDELIARIDTDEMNREHILEALAWIGDETVVQLFNRWKNTSLPWYSSLFIPPQDYSYYAGWELTNDGQRRDLYFPHCTELSPGASTAPHAFQAIVNANYACPWCNRALIKLVEFHPSTFNLFAMNNETDSVQITTCDSCVKTTTIFDLTQGKQNPWTPENLYSEDLLDNPQEWEEEALPLNSLTPGGMRSARFAVDQFLPTSFSQIGGLPTRIENTHYPHCPSCTKTMMFLGQLAQKDMVEDSEGIFYMFICLSCQTTAANYQQT